MFTVYWLLAAAACLVAEIVTVGLVGIWFAGGALAAALVSVITDLLLVQVVVFIVVSVALLMVTRPLAKKHLNEKIKETNLDALIGRELVVLETIDPETGKGKVKINDVEWRAYPEDGESIFEEGEKVVVREISGVKLIVDRLEEETEEEEVKEDPNKEE